MSSIRLQQILARAGVASRRSSEAIIAAGRVRINGEVVTELGTRADPDKDEITVDGERVGPAQEPATIVLHKPDEVVTTMDDPRGRETVADIVAGEPYRFVPVGRLDYHTEGLLLLTTDGELVHRLLHPRFHVPKVYQVKVRGQVGARALNQLREGVTLEDGPTRPTVVEILDTGARHTWLELVVTEGRNRLVRRMTEAVGHDALRVVRTEMATLELGDLRPGQYRYLEPSELNAVYRTADLDVPYPSDRAKKTEGVVLGKTRRGRGRLPGEAGFEEGDPSGAPAARNSDDDRPRGRSGDGERRRSEGAGGGRRAGRGTGERANPRGADDHDALGGRREGRSGDHDAFGGRSEGRARGRASSGGRDERRSGGRGSFGERDGRSGGRSAFGDRPRGRSGGRSASEGRDERRSGGRGSFGDRPEGRSGGRSEGRSGGRGSSGGRDERRSGGRGSSEGRSEGGSDGRRTFRSGGERTSASGRSSGGRGGASSGRGGRGSSNERSGRDEGPAGTGGGRPKGSSRRPGRGKPRGG